MSVAQSATAFTNNQLAFPQEGTPVRRTVHTTRFHPIGLPDSGDRSAVEVVSVLWFRFACKLTSVRALV